MVQSAPEETTCLLGAQDGVFGSFGDAELYDAFGRDLDLFARSGIAPDARGAIDQDQLAQSGQRKSILGVFVGQISDAIEDLDSLFLAESVLFSDCGGDL